MKNIVLIILILFTFNFNNNTIFGTQNVSAKSAGDYIIPGMDPPVTYFEINGGSCGEACLWTILKSAGKKTSQLKINRTGTNKNRGLHSHELFTILKKYKIKHLNLSSRINSYKYFIKNKLIKNIKEGHPVLLGVKIYPDEYPRWACDHFILLVGYNETKNEFIYNSNAGRERIKVNKLLNTDTGYSVMSRHKFIFAIRIF